MNFVSNMEAKGYFQVMRERFNKARAVRMTAKRFEVSQAEVLRAAYYW